MAACQDMSNWASADNPAAVERRTLARKKHLRPLVDVHFDLDADDPPSA
jgi:hypothetical protein